MSALQVSEYTKYQHDVPAAVAQLSSVLCMWTNKCPCWHVYVSACALYLDRFI
jgi:hypothetical protein